MQTTVNTGQGNGHHMASLPIVIQDKRVLNRISTL